MINKKVICIIVLLVSMLLPLGAQVVESTNEMEVIPSKKKEEETKWENIKL